MIAAVGLLCAFLTFAVSMSGKGPDLYWNEMHHAYLGWVLVSAGILFGWQPMILVGLVIAWDDGLQHALQNVEGWETKRLSLLAWIWYGTIGKAVHRLLGRYLDKRFE